jgi:hypothetical protein
LCGETYKLAFTAGLLGRVYRRKLGEAEENLLPDRAAVLKQEGQPDQGGYVRSGDQKALGLFPKTDADDDWWIPSGKIFYSPERVAPDQELAFARAHFFLPHRFEDPFGQPTTVTYDQRYTLLLQETCDAAGNRITVGERHENGTLTKDGNDYRVLQPKLVMDANRNRSAVAFDALGMVVGTAVMGKPPPARAEGDVLDDRFEPDLPDETAFDHLAYPLADPRSILGGATTRLVYDLFAYHRTRDQAEPQPAVVYTMARETHDSDPVPPGGLRIQHSFSYSDGFGREIQKKIQAEPGPVPKRDDAGKIILGADRQPEMTPDDRSPRWVGSGWTVFNNKGKPVRKYEPFFTVRHTFEFDVKIGVSPVLLYDPLERVIATLHPDHTWEKVVFDPWRQETWDVGDAVRVRDPETGDYVDDPRKDPDIGAWFERLPEEDHLPTWYARRIGETWGDTEQQRTANKVAAEKALKYVGTPTVAHFDTLGRTFLTIARNRFDKKQHGEFTTVEDDHETRIELDIEGNQRSITDALGRIVMRYSYDMLGNRIAQVSMDAGSRWMVNDVAGNPIRSWDSRGHAFQMRYDRLRRLIGRKVIGADPKDPTGPILIERIDYGETEDGAEALRHNLRTRIARHYDGAGLVINEEYDFKGNLHSPTFPRRDCSSPRSGGAVSSRPSDRCSASDGGHFRPGAMTRPGRPCRSPTNRERRPKICFRPAENGQACTALRMRSRMH